MGKPNTVHGEIRYLEGSLWFPRGWPNHEGQKKNHRQAKPGISPLLLGKTLLPNSVFLRLSDCVENLVPYEEEVYEIEMNQSRQNTTRNSKSR